MNCEGGKKDECCCVVCDSDMWWLDVVEKKEMHLKREKTILVRKLGSTKLSVLFVSHIIWMWGRSSILEKQRYYIMTKNYILSPCLAARRFFRSSAISKRDRTGGMHPHPQRSL